MRKKIGEYLIQAGLISEKDLAHALAEHKRTGERLGVVLVRLNLADEEQIAKTLASQLGFPYVRLAESFPEPAAVNSIPKELALRRVCVGVRLEKNLLTVAMSDPLMFSLAQDLERRTGWRISQVVATRTDILDAIERCYPDRPAQPTVPSSTTADLKAGTGAPPIGELVDLIVKSAIKSQATDIHIEPTAKGVVVRQRLGSFLKEVMDLPAPVHDGLIERLKAMAGMDVTERRLPQDGRLRVAADDGAESNFRVSTLRTLFGEKLVMRVLAHRKGVLPLEEIGMSATALERFRQCLGPGHGMILVVGSTGSGRSTTLGSALSSIRSETTNVVTIEDPVEYVIPGANQTQIDEQIGLTFPRALRATLQQDPDVILIGEIRDAETARLAVRAAQRGVIVLSTLRAEEATSAISRLIDMGIDPHDVARALVTVVGQRLVRRLCARCRRQSTPLPETLRALSPADADVVAGPFYGSVGCDQCNHTGFCGRIGIYEVMSIDDRIRKLIRARSPEAEIREAALAGGMTSLGEDGFAKVKSGVTTVEELLRVVPVVREVRTLCPACGIAVGVDFNACPSCGKPLGRRCPQCGRALQPEWNFCPYCARGTLERGAKRAGDRDAREGGDGPRGIPPGNVAEFKK